MVSYCFLTGAHRAVLVYPAETLAEPAAFRFTAPDGQVVSVETVGFDLSGVSQVQWIHNARSLTDQLSRAQGGRPSGDQVTPVLPVEREIRS